MSDVRNDVRNDARNDVRAALRDADWEALLPQLVAYAARRLRRAGWASGRDEEPSKMSVEQLIHTAVELSLDGTRTWNPEAVDLAGFLRGIIRSITSSERKKYVRAKTVTSSEIAESYSGVAESAESDVLEEENRKELLAEIEACTADDEDLRDFYLAVIEGNTKREDIAKELGWTADRVTAARIKLQRRLVKRAPQRFATVREKRRRTS